MTTTSTPVELYEGEKAGGELREEVEAKGEQEAKVYEEMVYNLLHRSDVCTNGYEWLNMQGGFF